MKKPITLIMAIAMLITLLCPLTTLAADGMSLWEIWEYDSLDDFLEQNQMTEDEYYAFEEEWMEYLRAYDEDLGIYEQELAQRRLMELEDLGALPGITNVMYNGKFIQFASAPPEFADGSLYVPADEFFAALGGQAGYDGESGAITAEFAGRTARLLVGRSEMAITVGTDEQRWELGKEPYLVDGAAYIPLGSVARAMGMKAFWDTAYNVAVIINTEEILAEAKGDFTVINSLFTLGDMLSAVYGDGQTMKTTADMSILVTMFDTLDGDSVIPVDASFTIISDGRNSAATLAINLYDLFMLIYGEDFGFLPDQLASVYGIDLDTMKDLKIDIIFNRDEDALYVKTPLLSMVYPEIPVGSWFAVSGVGSGLLGEDMGLTDISGLIGGDVLGFPEGGSLEEILVTSYFYDRPYYEYYDGVYHIIDDPYGANAYYAIHDYQSITEELAFCKELFGDEKFATDGGTRSMEITMEDYYAATEKFDQYASYTDFGLKLKITEVGGAVLGLSGEVVVREDDYYSATRTTVSFDVSPDGIALDVEIHEKNTQKINIHFVISMAPTSEPVPAAPPAGETVVTIDDLDPGMDDPIPYLMPMAGH